MSNPSAGHPGTDTLTVAGRGRPFTAELHRPACPAGLGLVLVAYGSDGLTDHLGGPWATMIRGHAQALVASGFSVLLPDYLAATGTAPGPGVFDVMARHRDAWAEALSDALDEGLKRVPCAPTQIGLLGFSLDGHLALRLRARARVLVEFFAPVLDGLGSGGPPGWPAHAQIHHGKADALPGTAFANAETVERTLRGEGVATELLAYPGAGHGFAGNDRDNRSARELSQARTLVCFQTWLAGVAAP